MGTDESHSLKRLLKLFLFLKAAPEGGLTASPGTLSTELGRRPGSSLPVTEEAVVILVR